MTPGSSAGAKQSGGPPASSGTRPAPQHSTAQEPGYLQRPQGRSGPDLHPTRDVSEGADCHLNAAERARQSSRHAAPPSDGERRSRSRLDDGCARSRHKVAPPQPGSLRPLARAFLSLAVEVYEVPRDACSTDSARKMGHRGNRRPDRSPDRSPVRSPATLERSGSGEASSHVRRPSPSPLVVPDCMGLSS